MRGPIRKGKALSLESASFFLMGSDVICELHVQVQGAPTAAADAARKLADAFAEVEPTAVVGPVRAWTPERYRAAPLEGMDSAQVDVQLPSDTAGRGGRRATFHVVTFGGLQHVLMRHCFHRVVHPPRGLGDPRGVPGEPSSR